jgi:hypothetical protein
MILFWKDLILCALSFRRLSNEGKISLAADDGLRPWWQRFIFGAKIYVRSYFMFEWSGEFCGLIFHDDNTSEFRALAKSECCDLDEETLCS